MEERLEGLKPPTEEVFVVCQRSPRMCDQVQLLSSELVALRNYGKGNGALETVKEGLDKLIGDCQTANQRKDDTTLPCVHQRHNVRRMIVSNKR